MKVLLVQEVLQVFRQSIFPNSNESQNAVRAVIVWVVFEEFFQYLFNFPIPSL